MFVGKKYFLVFFTIFSVLFFNIRGENISVVDSEKLKEVTNTDLKISIKIEKYGKDLFAVVGYKNVSKDKIIGIGKYYHPFCDSDYRAVEVFSIFKDRFILGILGLNKITPPLEFVEERPLYSRLPLRGVEDYLLFGPRASFERRIKLNGSGGFKFDKGKSKYYIMIMTHYREFYYKEEALTMKEGDREVFSDEFPFEYEP